MRIIDVYLNSGFSEEVISGEINIIDTERTKFPIGEGDFPLYFSEWLKGRRQELDLTQAQLAKRACCSVFAIRKIEMGERRPSRQLAELLAKSLEIPSEHQATFIKVARGELNIERLRCIGPAGEAEGSIDFIPPPAPINLPFQPTSFIGREAELAALGKLLADPQCRLLTITGLGGIGKTRLAIQLASNEQALFPGGVYYVSLVSLNYPEFITPAIAEVLKFSFSGTGNPQEQLIKHLAVQCRQSMLLVLDNLEHLLVPSSNQEKNDETALLLSKLLENLPNLKILATSRERGNLRGEWIFEVHGLPVPTNDPSSRLEDYSAVTLFLQCARQLKVDFELVSAERPWLARVCQLVEGTPLALELAAAWVSMLSMEEIAEEIASNLDFLTSRMRNIPERHRSLKAVFAHSWKLLSAEEKQVLCRLAVFRGGFQRQAAEQVAGASLPVLQSLLSKSLMERRANGRYDLHALIRQCSLEKLQESGYFEETCHQHLAYFNSLALEAQDGLRGSQLAEWLNRIEQEHNNIRAALEWAFNTSAPSEWVEEGLCLLTSIDRYWAARGHIREGITWAERGLQASKTISLSRAQALRFAGWLHNHIGDGQTAIPFLEESLSIARQLNDETWQANALDSLGDVFWGYGDFQKASANYAESLELYRRGGDARKIGLSLASAGRLYVDNGYYQEAEALLTEGLYLLESVSELRGCGWCLNALGRLAVFQGELTLAARRFRQALRVNYELGYMVDIADGLHSLAVIEIIAGNESSATLLRAAATKLQNRIGFIYPDSDPLHRKIPAAWLQIASSSQEWQRGEMMPLDQIVAYALEREAE